MSWAFRLTGWAPWIAGTFVIAGLVHIISILAMPMLATEDAYARLSPGTPPGQLVILQNESSGKVLLPYEDPATVIAA